MSKPTERRGPLRPDLEQRVKSIALTLGMLWDGMGGAYREQLPDGRAVWRVYDQWGGLGGSAVIDAANEELLSIDETPPERDASVVPLPPKQRPDEAELLAFARKQLGVLKWRVPAGMVVVQGKTDKDWRVQSEEAESPTVLEIQGGKGRLHLIRISRL